MVFPEAVDAEGHKVVHCIVRRGDGGKDGGDAGGFCERGDLLEAEVGGCLG